MKNTQYFNVSIDNIEKLNSGIEWDCPSYFRANFEHSHSIIDVFTPNCN